MAGSNVFANTGAGFIPADRNSTASVNARNTSGGFTGVPRVFYTTPQSRIWLGYPAPATGLTVSNNRTGTFPNLANKIVVTWTLPTVVVPISGFNIFASTGGGFVKLNSSLLSSSTTSYDYGNQSVGTYSFYIETVGINNLKTSTSAQSRTLAAAPGVGAISSSKTTTSVTGSWTVTAGVFQRFHVYDSGTYLGEVLATESGTSYSWTRSSLSQGTAYNIRVYGQNYDGFWSGYNEANITTNTLTAPTISWSSSSATKYSDWSVTWTGVAGETYQPEYYKTSWLNNGGTLSGAGTKTSPTQTTAYDTTLYMRVQVTDQHGATATTNQINVKAGRVLIQESSWKDAGRAYYSNSHGANAANWGNISGLSFVCNSEQDWYIHEAKITGYSVHSPTKDITLVTNRRMRVNSSYSIFRAYNFDGLRNSSSSPAEFYTSARNNWSTSEGAGWATYNYGVSDDATYFDYNSIAWRYGDGVADNWNGGAASVIGMRIDAQKRVYTTTTTQSQVDSTYA